MEDRRRHDDGQRRHGLVTEVLHHLLVGVQGQVGAVLLGGRAEGQDDDGACFRRASASARRDRRDRRPASRPAQRSGRGAQRKTKAARRRSPNYRPRVTDSRVERIVEEEPFEHRKRQAAVRQQRVVEGAEPEVVAVAVAVLAEQAHDLPLPDHVGDLLRRARGGAGGFAFRRLAVEPAGLHEVLHRLLEGPAPVCRFTSTPMRAAR